MKIGDRFDKKDDVTNAYRHEVLNGPLRRRERGYSGGPLVTNAYRHEVLNGQHLCKSLIANVASRHLDGRSILGKFSCIARESLWRYSFTSC